MIPKPVREVKAPRPLRKSRKPIARGKRPAKVRGAVAKRRAARRAETLRKDAKWAAIVRARSPYYCESCDQWMVAPGDPHHLWPKGDYPKLRHVVANGIHLHRECHEEAHRDMKWFRAWFAEGFPERWARLEAARLG